MTRFGIQWEIYYFTQLYIVSPLFWYTMYRLAMGYADRKIREAEGVWKPKVSNLREFLKGVGIYLALYFLVYAVSGSYYNFRGLMSSITPIVIIVCFCKLYFRMGKANYLTITSNVNPDHVKDVSNGEILGHIATIQAITSIAIHQRDKRRK